jgi:hypothetical protein
MVKSHICYLLGVERRGKGKEKEGGLVFLLFGCDYMSIHISISIHIYLCVCGLKSGRTALYGACEYGHESIVSLLLEKGANLDERTEVFGY